LASVAEKEHIPVEREALNVIALKADGGLRDALSIFDQIASFSNRNITYQSTIDNLNVLDYEYFFKLTDCCLSENYVEALLIYDQILDKGFEGNNFLSGLTAHFRNVLVSKDPQTVQLLEVGDAIRERYLQQAQNCTVDFLYKAMDFTSKFDEKYKQSNNKRLHVELALLHICNILKKKALT
jgi:DNA polymerase-3 subunit gamma/tau